MDKDYMDLDQYDNDDWERLQTALHYTPRKRLPSVKRIVFWVIVLVSSVTFWYIFASAVAGLVEAWGL